MEEATQPKVCRCLLRDMTGENDYLRSVERYRATMPRRLRTPDALYETRLACCRDCEALQNGTCMQCGCYVEMRAARSDRKSHRRYAGGGSFQHIHPNGIMRR